MDSVESSQVALEPPILRLPPALRRQIYSNYHEALGGTPFTFCLHGRNSKTALGIRALLLSCRAIYGEVSDVLYSTNFFEIKCEGTKSLRRIRRLSDAALSSLTELKVVLNEASCNHPICNNCCDQRFKGFAVCPTLCDAKINGGHDQALWPSDYSANSLLGDWRLTAAYIWSRVKPRKLNISLICDFDPQDPRSSSAAKLAVAPLINLSPLRGCHIRLCRTPPQDLAQIARSSVLRARGLVDQEESACNWSNATAESGSMLTSLPRELRFRVLEYTDLITPWKEIRWSRQHKGYLPSIVHCYREDCLAKLHHGCQFWRCWSGFVSPNFTDPRTQVGCFCRVRHAAFSFNCQCWCPPTYLFLVCRTLYKDAQVVFFSSNRFVVHDYNSDTPWHTFATGRYPKERLAVTKFLTEVVPADCLPQIRSLEVTFPPYNHDEWPRDGCRALRQWSESVQLIKEKMNMSGLTLRLTMYDSRNTYEQGREEITKPQAREILQAYIRILAPLTGLGEEGLKAFYAHMTLPDKSTSWFMDKWPKGFDYLERVLQKERILKERAERLVMGSRHEEQPGEDFYWRWEPMESVWRHEYINPY